MNIKAVLFDLDDTLYSSTSVAQRSRTAAIQAMIDKGLEIDLKVAYKLYMDIVREYGSNYEHHLERLLERLNKKIDMKLVAAGVIAYHNIKIAYLTNRPYADVIPTLLKLKELNKSLAIVTSGIAIKQWDKLLRLGIVDFFDYVATSEEVGVDKPKVGVFRESLSKLNIKNENTLFVGDSENDIVGALDAKIIAVRLKKGKHAKYEFSKKPDFTINSISEVINLIKELEKNKKKV